MESPNGHVHLSLQNALRNIWNINVYSTVLLGAGVYGHIHGVTFDKYPYRAIVKIHKYPVMAGQETRQLQGRRIGMIQFS